MFYHRCYHTCEHTKVQYIVSIFDESAIYIYIYIYVIASAVVIGNISCGIWEY